MNQKQIQNKEDHFIIVWLSEQWKSYDQIVAETWFKKPKVKYHLLSKNRRKS